MILYQLRGRSVVDLVLGGSIYMSFLYLVFLLKRQFEKNL